jgi:hypothetical protein
MPCLRWTDAAAAWNPIPWSAIFTAGAFTAIGDPVAFFLFVATPDPFLEPPDITRSMWTLPAPEGL